MSEWRDDVGGGGDGPLRRSSGHGGGASAAWRHTRRVSRTRPTIERHVPLAAGRPLRPTESHFFIFPPNVAIADSQKITQKLFDNSKIAVDCIVVVVRPPPSAPPSRRVVWSKPIWQDEAVRLVREASDPTVLFAVCVSLYKCYASWGRSAYEKVHLLIELARGSAGAVNRRAHVTPTSALYREYHDLYLLIPTQTSYSCTHTTQKWPKVTISKGCYQKILEKGIVVVRPLSIDRYLVREYCLYFLSKV